MTSSDEIRLQVGPNHTPVVTQHSGSKIELSGASSFSNHAHSNDTLPIEILVYIFGLASAPSLSIFDIESQALWSGRLTLATIISVCRLWRDAALGAQLLWSTIVLPFGSKHIQKCLKVSLQYSGQALIDIFFFPLSGRAVYDIDGRKAREYAKILDTLSHSDVSSRLRTINNIPMVSLGLRGYQPRRAIGKLLRKANQTIQAVGILDWECSRHDDPTLTYSSIIDILGCLPASVRRLSIPAHVQGNGIMRHILTSPTLESLWGCLSYLTITGPYCIYLMEAMELLRKCVALEECQLSSVTGAFLEHDDIHGPMFGKERLILPHLRQLVIQQFDGDATWLLDAFNFPALVNLAVKQNPMISSVAMDHADLMRWENFIQRSFSIAPSPEDVLHEVWVHGLSKKSIEYLLSSDAVMKVRSIALAQNPWTLTYPGCAHCPDSDPPLAPCFELRNVYIDAAEDYGLPVTDVLRKYDTVPWYGWNRSMLPLHLSAFAIQCLEKAKSWVDVSTHIDRLTQFGIPTILDLD